MQILSFQSAVAFGHVGNSAAVLPLQRLGFEVWPVDTVQFSNHPGHGQWSGAPLPAQHLSQLVDGLERVGALAATDGVLSGYLGEAGAADAVLRAVALVRRAKPRAIYLCDPVLGDDGPGLYVKPGIAEAMAQRLLPAAGVVTPNRFELALLSGRAVSSLADAAEAARLLLGRGPSMVVATSLDGGGATVACLAVTAQGAWAVRTPRLAFPVEPNGAGDLLSAVLLGHLLQGRDLPEALSMAVSSLYGVLVRTLEGGRRELALVAAQEEFVLPSRFFPALGV